MGLSVTHHGEHSTMNHLEYLVKPAVGTVEVAAAPVVHLVEDDGVAVDICVSGHSLVQTYNENAAVDTLKVARILLVYTNTHTHKQRHYYLNTGIHIVKCMLLLPFPC